MNKMDCNLLENILKGKVYLIFRRQIYQETFFMVLKFHLTLVYALFVNIIILVY